MSKRVIWKQSRESTHLKNPLHPSQVMALKWKPVALSPHTPQIRGALRSNSSGPTTDVVTVMGSITEESTKAKEGIDVKSHGPESNKQSLKRYESALKVWNIYCKLASPTLI